MQKKTHSGYAILMSGLLINVFEIHVTQKPEPEHASSSQSTKAAMHHRWEPAPKLIASLFYFSRSQALQCVGTLMLSAVAEKHVEFQQSLLLDPTNSRQCKLVICMYRCSKGAQCASSA